MAFTKLLIVFGLAAVVQAGYAYSQAYANANGNGWPGPYFPSNFPFNNMPFNNLPFNPFPSSFPFSPSMIKVPSPADIAAIQPGPGQDFNGMIVQSESAYTWDKDGKVVKKGGSTIMTNDNGVVNTFTVGNSPPVINKVVTVPPIPDIKFHEIPDIKFPEFPKFKPFEFKPIIIKPIKPINIKPIKPINIKPIKPIDPEDILTHVPKKNEKFFGFHLSSSNKFSNNNGVKSSSGESHVLVNDNGKVDQDSVRYQQGDEPHQGEEKKTKANEDRFKYKPLKFKSIKPIVIKPHKIDKDELKNRVPKKNEHFVVFSTSSFGHSEDINGVKKASGGSETLLNNNGKIDEQKTKFTAGDKTKSTDKVTVTVEDE